MFGLGPSVFANQARGNVARFNPAPLFREGDDGFLANFSDLNSMFQESAAAVPVTGPGDPCAALQDRSGNDHIAVQSVNDDYRPVLGRHPRSGARQMLDRSDDLAAAPWSGLPTVTPGTHVSPSGALDAATVTASGTGSTDYLSAANIVPLEGGIRKSIYARTVSGTGTVGLMSYGASTGATVSLTEDWQRFDLGWLSDDPENTHFYLVDFRVGTLDEVVVWGPQLEPGETATAYQSRVDQYDITEAGQPDVWYMQMDGVDDRLLVPSRFGMSAAPDMTVVAAFRVDDQQAVNRIWELGSGAVGDIAGTAGVLGISYRHNDGNVVFDGVIADSGTAVLTFVKSEGDTYGEGRARLQGAELLVNYDGNPTNTPVDTSESFSIGAGPNGQNPTKCKLYGLMIINRVLTDAEIARVEQYFAHQSGVTL